MWKETASTRRGLRDPVILKTDVIQRLAGFPPSLAAHPVGGWLACRFRGSSKLHVLDQSMPEVESTDIEPADYDYGCGDLLWVDDRLYAIRSSDSYSPGIASFDTNNSFSKVAECSRVDERYAGYVFLAIAPNKQLIYTVGYFDADTRSNPTGVDFTDEIVALDAQTLEGASPLWPECLYAGSGRLGRGRR